MRHLTLLCVVVALTIPLNADEPAATPGPELKDGDVVALIGNTFIEREGQYGYIETALTARYADRDIKFRNLGWSGDTVWCESRAYFGTPEDGFKHLLEHVDLVKPTVIILNYGGNEAFAGEAGLENFIKGYERLLDELEKRTKRIILLSPTPLEESEVTKSNIEQQNSNRETYTHAIDVLAKKRDHDFINTFSHTLRWMEKSQHDLTDDGVTLNAAGYLATAGIIDAFMAGGYTGAWNNPEDNLQKLRRAIVEKNELFFHRHRPQNETYLRGFRKHEQGNNAVEITQFEPLIEAKEKEIADIRNELLKTLQAKEGAK